MVIFTGMLCFKWYSILTEIFSKTNLLFFTINELHFFLSLTKEMPLVW